MRFLSLFSLLGYVAARGFEAGTSGSGANIVPNQYIVEFDNAAHLKGGLSSRGLSAHDHFYAQLKARGVPYEVKAEFKTENIFVGASVEVQTLDDLGKLTNASGVVNVWPVRKYTLPPLQSNGFDEAQAATKFNTRAEATNTTKAVGVTKVNNGNSTTSGNSTTAAQNTTQVKTQNSQDGVYGSYSQLPTIGADKIHKLGNTGRGVIVGVIDTGVDYTHPALGGCFGANCKVRKGYDFVGDNYPTTTVEDGDPQDCLGHGTMVAGLIAASDNVYNAPGVAPDAVIYAYKVFGCVDTTDDNVMIKAMLRAMSDGVDVINMSIGGTTGWTFGASSVVAARVSNSGIQCVISGGNSGSNGMFYPSSPAAGRGVLSVGSVDPAGTVVSRATVSANGQSFNVIYNNVSSIYPSSTPLKLYVANSDICPPTGSTNGMPANAPADLSGYAVIVKRGSCTFQEKAQQIANRGGAVLLFHNNSPTGVQPGGITANIPFAVISQPDGNLITTFYLGQGADPLTNPTTMTFGIQSAFLTYSTAGKLTSFSSLGPTYDMFGTPHVTAPGLGIFGLAPVKSGSWTSMSGTSFSSPLTAGCAALWIAAKRSANEAWNTQALRDAFQATASNVVHTAKSEPVAFVGSGTVNVYNAIYAGSKVSPSELLLNDTEYFSGTKYIMVTNTDSKSNTYQLAHQPAGLVYGMKTGQKIMANKADLVYDESDNLAAGVKFSRTSFTLAKGASTIVILQFTAPIGATAAQLPVYSGYITITGGPVPLRVSYMGAATKMRDLPQIDTSTTTYGTKSPTLCMGSSWTEMPAEQKFDFTNPSTTDSNTYPKIAWKGLSGSNWVSVDVVAENANLGFTPTYTRRDFEEREETNATNVPEGLIAHFASSRRSVNHGLGRSSLARRSRRSPPVEVRSEEPSSALVARADDKISAALKLWCQLTNYKGAGCTSNSGTAKENTFAKVPIVGNYHASDQWWRNDNNVDNNHNNDVNYIWLNTKRMSDGSILQKGRYKILLRVLKVNGDPTQQSDYESWLSPVFEVI